MRRVMTKYYAVAVRVVVKILRQLSVKLSIIAWI